MKTKTSFLLAILTAISVASVRAQYTTNTLTFSGASWNDGGSLDGYFTVQYDAGTPTALLSLDVTTGNGTSDGFIGYDYIYNVSGQNNTVYYANINQEQNNGAPANELNVINYNNIMYLDWQGSSPTSLYVGDGGGQYSSETEFSPEMGVRTLNEDGGSPGPVPEPSTLALAAVGGLGLLLFRRRK
jgi:hypothetical protein